ncbi:MAG: S9 family peptidase, partial [Candidatus Latescibacterota bacterium]
MSKAQGRSAGIAALLFLSIAVVAARAGAAAPPERTHDIVPEDYFTQGFIGDLALSPDGRLVAFTDLRWDLDADTRHTDVWVADVKTHEMRRLTFHPANDGRPLWSADGRWVYFTSARGEEDDRPPLNGKTQVWKAPAGGGEPVPVTRFKEGVDDYALSDDGRTLYYVKSSEAVEDPWKEMKEKFDDLEYGQGVMNYSEVWSLDLETWRTEKLVDEDRVVRQFAVSPGGDRIAMITTPDEEAITNEGLSRVDVWDRKTKSVATVPDKLWREDAPSPYGWLEGLAWSADGADLAFRVDFDGYPSELLVAHFDGAEVRPHRLVREGEFSLGGDPTMRWLGGDLCFLSEEKARVRVARIRDIRPGGQGRYEILTPGDWVAKGFAISADGRTLAAALGDVTQPNDVFVTSLGGKPKLERVTRINPQVDTWKLPEIRIVKWAGARGDTVEGILELPFDYQPGTKLPLHLALHGGPSDADRYYFEYWIYGRGLWPTLGWAVFAPNYRGSTGFGD